MDSTLPAHPAPALSDSAIAFATERHLATLTTLRADGSPHIVPVGFTLDLGEQAAGSSTTSAIIGRAGRPIVRIITSGPGQKVLNVRRDGRAGVCQVDGARWLTLSGAARILSDPDSVSDAVARYAIRYRQPRENPLRVVIAIEVDRVMGSAGMLAV